ncbi:MAG: hypothetical protein ACHQ1D_09515, partial [Nitrososphaerales archaeon]
ITHLRTNRRPKQKFYKARRPEICAVEENKISATTVNGASALGATTSSFSLTWEPTDIEN